MSDKDSKVISYASAFDLLWTAALVVATCLSFYWFGYRTGEHDATLRAQAAIDEKFNELRERGGYTSAAYRACVFTSSN